MLFFGSFTSLLFILVVSMDIKYRVEIASEEYTFQTRSCNSSGLVYYPLKEGEEAQNDHSDYICSWATISNNAL